MDASVYLLLLVCVIGAWTPVDARDYFAVVAPNVIRYNHNETVSISIFGSLTNKDVEVWLGNKGKQFSKRKVQIQDKEHPQTVMIKATEADIFDTRLAERAMHVTLKATCAGYPVQSAQLLVNYHSGYIIVQTDKPLYTQGNSVNYRVMALDEGLKAATDVPLTIDIIDPRNRTVRRTRRTGGASSNSAFYTEDAPFDIEKYTELGLWTIKAFYQGQFSTEARAIFEVQKYILPTFDVNVTVTEHCVLPETTDLHVTVEGKYVYGEPVQGKVSMHINVTSEAGSHFAMKMKETMLGHNGIYDFTVNMAALLNSPTVTSGNWDDNFPPNGYHLDIRADVFELATGNEETGLARVIFAQTPYIFKFDRSRKTYRPGQSYDLQVEVFHADGKSLTNEEIEITKSAKKKETAITRLKNGLLYKAFNTKDEATSKPQLTFKVAVYGFESDEFRVSPYQGTNQVKIEKITTDVGTPQLRIAGNMRGGRHTGLTLLIIARGTILHSEYFGVATTFKHDIDDETFKLLSPSARAVAFYFDFTTQEVVTDSVSFYIEPPKCRGAGLTISTNDDEYTPGSTGMMYLRGAPYMDVRLNVIDKALLLLNSDNILHTDTMFRLLKQHDIGCGVGDGSTSSEIIKNAGLVLLTNAKMASLDRDSLSCDENRRKRAIDEACQANEVCCDMGAKYGQKLLKEQRTWIELGLDAGDLVTKCYSMAHSLKKERAPPIVCLSAYLRTCFYVVEKEAGSIQVQGKSLIDDSDYTSEIERLELDDPKIRSKFQESWLFDQVVQLGSNGHNTQGFFMRDSITTWRMQAIGFSSDEGVCIAKPVDVRGYKQFFLQLDMPYSAVRFEIAAIKVTVFNYFMDNIKVKVYIEGVLDLCSNAVPGKKSPRQQGELKGNSAMTFTFHVRPLRIRDYDITVFALADTGGVNQQDAVKKPLRVRGEGKTIIKTKHVCLDPRKEMKTCENENGITENRVAGTQILEIKLDRPPNAVPGTFFAVGYIKTDILSDIVEAIIGGTESLLDMPTGCGEQTMAILAPTVYAMSYIRETRQMTPFTEANGTLYIRSGVEHELQNYRKDDNSYAIYKSWTSSTWLTAYVMKVFCQAQKVIDDIDTATHVVPSLEWLLTRQRDGKFFDDTRVYDRRLRGQLKEDDPSLTALVIISFMECDGRTSAMNSTVSEAVKYLGDLDPTEYIDDEYLLAIVTYALALADSPQKHVLMRRLQSSAKTGGANTVMYWGTPGGSPANANSVETTSYALLAYLNFQYDTDSAAIARWLIQQRGGKGAFRTTIDTVVGLQALTEYSKRTKLMDIDLQVSIPQGKNTLEFHVQKEYVRKVAIKDDATQLSVRVVGSGGAYLDIDYGYNVLQETKCPFNVTEIKITNITDSPPIDPVFAGECDVCGVCVNDTDANTFDYDDTEQLQLPISAGSITANGKSLRRRRRSAEQKEIKYCVNFELSSDWETGMAMVSFGLQTGVRVIQRDLDVLLQKQPRVARYELPDDGKAYVIFYVKEMSPDPVPFKFRLIDEQADDADKRQPANVDFYEYYKPERACNKFYDVYGKRRTPASYQCMEPGKRLNCFCLQSVCASNHEAKLKRSFNRRKKSKKAESPVEGLEKRICSTDKANYAVLVRMGQPEDGENQQKIIQATVVDAIHGGPESLRRNMKMTFRYKAFCTYPKIQAGQQYYVIAGSNEVGVYELMEDAIVIRKPRRGIIHTVMSRFTRLMKTDGCSD